MMITSGRIVLGLEPVSSVFLTEEIANIALFLASVESSFATGIELFVDGVMAVQSTATT